jgi:hypothetical protein
MGYLDNSTVVVDAILTKEGRKLLATGNALNIRYFTLSDTGIDYTLWNPDHPSGSAYYGEAIENLPNLEALPNGAYFMRNKLLSLDRNTTALPYIDDNMPDITIAAGGSPYPFQPTVSNTPGGSSNQFIMVVPDTQVASFSGGQPIDIGGNALTFVNEQDIPQAGAWYGPGPFQVENNIALTTTKTITLTFISVGTGAYRSVNVTLEAA